MKLGIDAKWFFEGPPSGKVVIRNLLHELLKKEFSGHKYYIFLRKEDNNKPFPYSGSHINLIYIPVFSNMVTNAVIVPYYSNKLGLHSMLYQNFGPLYGWKNSIVYIHDLLYLDYPSFYSIKERIYLAPIKYLAKKAKYLVTISKTERNRLINHGFGNKDDVFYVYHGVNKSFGPLDSINQDQVLEVKEKYMLPEKYILFLGRLNIRKNIKNLLLAMKEVEATLVIAGKEDHKTENLNQIIRDNELTEKVIFTGHVEDEHLPIVYAMATIFCFPSYAEGFGLPPLEAMACGVPVVSSDRTSLKEVCGEGALFVNPDQPDDIVRKLNILLNSPTARSNQVVKGLKRAEQFSWDKSAKELLQILQKP